MSSAITTKHIVCCQVVCYTVPLTVHHRTNHDLQELEETLIQIS